MLNCFLEIVFWVVIKEKFLEIVFVVILWVIIEMFFVVVFWVIVFFVREVLNLDWGKE